MMHPKTCWLMMCQTANTDQTGYFFFLFPGSYTNINFHPFLPHGHRSIFNLKRSLVNFFIIVSFREFLEFYADSVDPDQTAHSVAFDLLL